MDPQGELGPKIESKADKILKEIREAVSLQKALNPKWWLDISFRLNDCLIDEEATLHEMRRVLAEKKVEMLDKMEKRNVSEAESRIEALKEHKEMQDQTTKCERIQEFIMLAKKNADTARGY